MSSRATVRDLSPKAKTFNGDELKQKIKEADPTIRQYIKALKEVIEMNKHTQAAAMEKINELSKEAARLSGKENK